MKVCTKCNVEKLPNGFYKDNSKKDKLTNICKICTKQQSTEWYNNNYDRHRANVDKWYNNNQNKLISLICKNNNKLLPGILTTSQC